jgi:hypothetical protein
LHWLISIAKELPYENNIHTAYGNPVHDTLQLMLMEDALREEPSDYISFFKRKYVKELKKMGFYVWTDEFNFGKGDEYERGSIERNKNYINTIEYYNNLSIQDIKKLYNQNFDKIENNYNLAKIVMENADWWNYNILDNVK